MADDAAEIGDAFKLVVKNAMRTEGAGQQKTNGCDVLNKRGMGRSRLLAEDDGAQRQRQDEKAALEMSKANPEDGQREQSRSRDRSARRPARGEESQNDCGQ